MTPLKFSMSSEFEYYARAMKEVEKQNVKSGKEAMKILQEWDIVSWNLLDMASHLY